MLWQGAVNPSHLSGKVGQRRGKARPAAKNRANRVERRDFYQQETEILSHTCFSPQRLSTPTSSSVCLCAEPDPAAPADDGPDSGPEPAADGSPAGPLPAELCSNQRHRWSHGGRCRGRSAARSGPGATQQETSDRALWGLLRHWGAAVRLPGQQIIAVHQQ